MNLSTLVLNLNVLQSYHNDFPFHLKLKVTQKLYRFKFLEILHLAETSSDGPNLKDSGELESAVSTLVESFALWNSNESSELMEHQNPSFAALYQQVKQLADGLGELPQARDDSDDELQQLRQEMKQKKVASSASHAGSDDAGSQDSDAGSMASRKRSGDQPDQAKQKKELHHQMEATGH